MRWPSGLERWTVRGSNPTAENFSLRNFGNSVYPALPVSFGGDTKSCRSLLSGVYARGSKRPHQSALECVTVVDSTAHSKNSPRSASMRRKTLPCTEKGRTEQVTYFYLKRNVMCQPASTGLDHALVVSRPWFDPDTSQMRHQYCFATNYYSEAENCFILKIKIIILVALFWKFAFTRNCYIK